ncbi:TauD/TfdA family dioxygenase [Kitasatospora sp. NPDC017646]|uniref:TauD/TfdA family dioxygenase n=1 Tax=Kitasatospora sp. NPDC017646 TaxID=3364024 RepID=UPI00378CDD26
MERPGPQRVGLADPPATRLLARTGRPAGTPGAGTGGAGRARRPAPARRPETLLASGHTVHNRLLTDEPWALPRLYQDFHFGRGTGLDRLRPVFQRHGAELRGHYNRRGIERAHQGAGVPLPSDDHAALDAVDRILSDPHTVLHIPLRPGDLLWLDNTVVLHGRTAFTDPPAPSAHRCLARVWAD